MSRPSPAGQGVPAERWQPHAQRLVAELRAQGLVIDTNTEQAFLTTPRHLFVPSFVDYQSGAIHQQPSSDPALEMWLSTVYSEAALVVALDERGKPRSSSTSPRIMALMLDQLALLPGATVLEVGTGTGYNAALLGRLVGDAGSVHTIEIDDELAREAAQRLQAAGCHNVIVHHGDATRPLSSPSWFERVIVTAGFRHIASAWWERLVDGGILVGNLRGSLAGGVAVVRRGGRGYGRGHFLDTANVGFTPLIGDERKGTPACEPADPAWRVTSEVEATYLDISQAGFRFLLQLELPGAEVSVHTTPDGTTVKLREAVSGGFLEFDQAKMVRGSTSLYEALRTSFQLWTDLGRPQLHQFEIEMEPPARQVMAVTGPNGLRHRWG
jgi:protein-L-isoaspartate(D-aspartate) O-methyltransferase